jgi:Excalibur calcium-binding domain
MLDTHRTWPLWAQAMAPVAAVMVVLALVSGLTGGAHESSDTHALATAGSTTTGRDGPQPSTTAAPPTTATPTTAAPTTVPPTLPPTTAAPTTVAPPPPPAPAPAPPAPAPAAAPGPVSYANCSEARAAGVTPLHRTDPGYAPHLDRDNDGIASE